MAESGFFDSPVAVTVAEVAEWTRASIRSGGDPGRPIAGIASLDAAGPDELSFFDNTRFGDVLAATRAGACFCAERHRQLVPEGTVALITREPHRAFAVAAARLYPQAVRPGS